MNHSNSLSRLSIAAAFGMLIAFGFPMSGQEAALEKEASASEQAPALNEVLQHNIEDWILQGRGIPDDWSHHHLVFSNPGTEEESFAKGTHDRWLSIVNDPRYIVQQLRRRAAEGPADTDIANAEGIAANAVTADRSPSAPSKDKKSKITKDWSVSLGSGTPATLTGVVGALSSSSISSSSTLTVDGVTFDANAPTSETATIRFSSSTKPSNSSSVTIGSVSYVFETSNITTAPATGCQVYSATNSTGATNLYDAITLNGTQGNTTYRCASSITAANSAVTASVSSSTVSLTAAIAGSTGFTFTDSSSPSPNFSTFSDTAGTDGTTSGTSSPPTFAYWSGSTYLSSASVAANIASAISNNTTLQTVSTGVSATANTPSSGDVTITARTAGVGGNSYAVTAASFSAFTGAGDLSGGATATVQPNAYPAKFSFSTASASCSNDFVIYPTGAQGATGAATIIAYKNLYTGGCSGTVPSVNWAYNTGAGEMVTTSPVLSLDGTQVAFIESNGTAASLVLIKWAAETGESVTAPLTLTNSASGSAYLSCSPTASAPCMYTITFANGKNDTLSAPFYDYNSDALYVGDDSGNLHQFTTVFNGAAAENTTSPWPVNLGTNKLSSPVYDPTYGDKVFVGDLGGVLHCVTASTGAIFGTSSALGGEIADAPLINSSANYVITFVDSDALYGFSEQYFPGGEGGPVSLGTGGTGHYLYAGAYDNLYYESSNGTGNIYVVGNSGGTAGATLYQVGLSGGFLTGGVTGVVTGLTASGAYPWPSPVTEFCNPGSASACAVNPQRNVTGSLTSGSKAFTVLASTPISAADVGAPISGTGIPSGDTIATVNSPTTGTLLTAATLKETNETLTIASWTTTGTDYAFFSVNRGTGCTNSGAGTGCVLSYNVSNPSSVVISGSGLNVTTPGTNGCWATGGIVIDNSVTSGNLAGASQTYFVNLNGAAAGGGANGGTPTSSTCTSGAAPTINATQASQSSP